MIGAGLKWMVEAGLLKMVDSNFNEIDVSVVGADDDSGYSKMSSYKHRTALSEQWKKIKPVSCTIDFILRRNEDKIPKGTAVMSYNILAPGKANDGFITKTGDEKADTLLVSLTNQFKASFGNLGDESRKSLSKNQSYARFAHAFVLGEDARRASENERSCVTDDVKKVYEKMTKLTNKEIVEIINPKSNDRFSEFVRMFNLIEKQRLSDSKKSRSHQDIEVDKAREAILLFIAPAGPGQTDEDKYNAISAYKILSKTLKKRLAWDSDDKGRAARIVSYLGMNKKQRTTNIWCLQEVDSKADKYFAENLKSHNIGYVSDKRDLGIAWDESVWEIKSEEETVVMSHILGVTLKHKKEGQEVVVYSIHLPSGAGEEKYKGRVKQLLNIRENEKVKAHLSGDIPMIIGMDANDPSGDTLVKYVFGYGGTDEDLPDYDGGEEKCEKDLELTNDMMNAFRPNESNPSDHAGVRWQSVSPPPVFGASSDDDDQSAHATFVSLWYEGNKLSGHVPYRLLLATKILHVLLKSDENKVRHCSSKDECTAELLASEIQKHRIILNKAPELPLILKEFKSIDSKKMVEIKAIDAQFIRFVMATYLSLKYAMSTQFDSHNYTPANILNALIKDHITSTKTNESDYNCEEAYMLYFKMSKKLYNTSLSNVFNEMLKYLNEGNIETHLNLIANMSKLTCE